MARTKKKKKNGARKRVEAREKKRMENMDKKKSGGKSPTSHLGLADNKVRAFLELEWVQAKEPVCP